jgi:hypothetical protein
VPSDASQPCPPGFTYARATTATGAVIVYCTATTTPVSADQLAQAPFCPSTPPPATVTTSDICGPGDVYSPPTKPLVCPDGNLPPSGADLCPSTAATPAGAPGCYNPAYPTVLSSVAFGPACFAPAPGYGCAPPAQFDWCVGAPVQRSAADLRSRGARRPGPLTKAADFKAAACLPCARRVDGQPICAACPSGLALFVATSPPNTPIYYCGTAQVSYQQAAEAVKLRSCEVSPPPAELRKPPAPPTSLPCRSVLCEAAAAAAPTAAAAGLGPMSAGLGHSLEIGSHCKRGSC